MDLEKILKRAKSINEKEDVGDREFILSELNKITAEIIASFENAKNTKQEKHNKIILLESHPTDKQLTQLIKEVKRLSYDSNISNKTKYKYQLVESFDVNEGRLRRVLKSSEENVLDKLQMYASYLKLKNNPPFLNIEELRRIKYNPANPKDFEIEKTRDEVLMDELNKIIYKNILVEKIEKILEPISAPFKYINKKIDECFYKYRYHPSGDIPRELIEKMYARTEEYSKKRQN